MRSITLTLLALATLSACDNGTQGAGETASPTGTATPSPTPDPAANETPVTEIPAAIRGRWGLVEADCDPARDDAKGLLTISATRLEFYESVGTLRTITESAPTRIRASFDFEGEGMNWKRDQTLDVQDDGATLVRREYGDDAAPGPFRYSKCS